MVPQLAPGPLLDCVSQGHSMDREVLPAQVVSQCLHDALSRCAMIASSTLCHLVFRFIESPVKPKKLKLGFFSWVWPTLQYSEQDCSGQQQGCRYPSQGQTPFPGCRPGAVCILHALVLHHPPSDPHHQGERADVLCSSLSLSWQQPCAAAAASLHLTHLLPLCCRATMLTSRYKLAAQPTLILTRWGAPRVRFSERQHSMPC